MGLWYASRCICCFRRGVRRFFRNFIGKVRVSFVVLFFVEGGLLLVAI